MFRSPDGRYWFATTDHYLARTNESSLASDYKQFKYYFGSEFNGFIQMHDGTWMAYGSGLVIFKRYDFNRITLKRPREEAVPYEDGYPVYSSTEIDQVTGAGSIKRMMISRQGEIWAVSNTYLARFEYAGIGNYRIKELFNGRFTSITEDDEGRLWVGQDDGLYRMVNGELVSYRDRHNAFSTVPLDLAFSERTGLWVATNGQGLLNFDPGSGRITEISTEEGLAANLCERLYLEGEEYLWVATKRGISRIDLSKILDTPSDAIQSISKADGLIANEVISLHFEGDTVIAATPAGLSVFHKKEIEYQLPAPPAYIRFIVQGDSTYSADSILSFSHRDNSPVIHLAGLSYGSLGEVSFRYRLDPIDEGWHSTNVPEVPYNQLRPGEYTFRVLAVTKDGVSSVEEAVLQFEIRKAWWQTIWFSLLVGFAFIALLWAVINWRYQQRSMRMKMQQQLADAERKALRAQMNPHFIFNSLNSHPKLSGAKRPQGGLYVPGQVWEVDAQYPRKL